MAKRKFNLYFRPELVNEPITYVLVKDFDLRFNILRAEVVEQGGQLLIEVDGKPAQITKGVAYLQSMGVTVKELNEFVTKDESRCTNCGMCVSICPADAIEMDRKDWTVKFHLEKCIACGLCVSSCPPLAMKLQA
ncbi:MAG: 4Fe-4S binding protein [Methanomassiliicoccus sp.]|jgi:ferredoxin|nr:4Fe-4S binding protein [Methanomassiliicoccus sp.]